MDEDVFEFAMVISVPKENLNSWERALRAAIPPPGMTMAVRSPSLALFTVMDIQEFLAIEKVEHFLEGIAKSAGVRCALNPQPSSEV